MWQGFRWRIWRRWTYGDNANTIAYNTKMRDINEINSSNIITTIEYLLICPECQHQTDYSYLWFAISDGRDHVLTSRHKLVTISEIVCQASS
jgi:hypothetical protein